MKRFHRAPWGFEEDTRVIPEIRNGEKKEKEKTTSPSERRVQCEAVATL